MNKLIRFNPFDEISELQKRFFDDDFISPVFKGLQLPTTDVYTEDNKRLVAEVHLPNFDEKDIDVHVDKGALVIHAEKHEKEEDKKKKYVVRESSSSFYRRFILPEQSDEKGIEAEMKNGLLRVVVPFKELPKPKKIAIKSKKSAK